VRDSPEKWYQSYRDSLHWMYRTWWFKPFAYTLPMGRKLNTIAKWWFTFAFGDDTMADKQRCIDAYHAHNAAIKAAIPADRLLVWDVKQGWAPLCECAPSLRTPRLMREDALRPPFDVLENMFIALFSNNSLLIAGPGTGRAGDACADAAGLAALHA